MSDILLIGGLGFVGSQLCRELESTNMSFDVYDNYMSGSLSLQQHIIKGDIRDRQKLDHVLPNYEYIVHLAGIVGPPACSVDEELSASINIMGTQNITELLGSDQKFIFISSTSAYGNQSDLVTEDTALAPLTNYGIHKKVGEEFTQDCAADFIIVRPATAFGASARIRIDLLPNTLTYLAVTRGLIDLFQPEVIRPFIHVKDFARVIQHALQEQIPWNTIYNIGDPSLTMTKADLAKHICNRTGAKLIIREGQDPDQRNYDVSFQRLVSTGFQFTANALDLGIQQILDNIIEIQNNYDLYCTPYTTRQFILKENNNDL